MSAYDDERRRWVAAVAVSGFSKRMRAVGRMQEAAWAKAQSLRALDSWSDMEVACFHDAAQRPAAQVEF